MVEFLVHEGSQLMLARTFTLRFQLGHSVLSVSLRCATGEGASWLRGLSTVEAFIFGSGFSVRGLGTLLACLPLLHEVEGALRN